MKLDLYQVDAFTDRVFGGNPAAVCPLDAWLPDEVLGSIALENNLSETAFFLPARDGGRDLRWFTPTTEVDLCGHATLASAHVLFARLGEPGDEIVFRTKSGPLVARRDGDRIALDLPARPAVPCAPVPALAEALGASPLETLDSGAYVSVYRDAETVRRLTPDMTRIAALDRRAVLVTAPGTAGECDFVSRFFAPKVGVPEDPVTGSAHCTLVPLWAPRLGKTEFVARQLSARGGLLFCRAAGDRVIVAGRTVLYLTGTIEI